MSVAEVVRKMYSMYAQAWQTYLFLTPLLQIPAGSQLIPLSPTEYLLPGSRASRD